MLCGDVPTLCGALPVLYGAFAMLCGGAYAAYVLKLFSREYSMLGSILTCILSLSDKKHKKGERNDLKSFNLASYRGNKGSRDFRPLSLVMQTGGCTGEWRLACTLDACHCRRSAVQGGKALGRGAQRQQWWNNPL
jgi:hypothetical protein